MKNQNQMNTAPYTTGSLNALDPEFENKVFKIEDKRNIGTQILKMEIMNSSDPKVSDLIEFIHNDLNGYSIWDMIKDEIGVCCGLSDGKWYKNEDNNYECIVEFFGSLAGKERRLLNYKWFTGVNIDFYFDTRRKLGHSSFSWEKCPQIAAFSNNRMYLVERVRYFTDKDYLTINHLDNYELFRDFISNPELFADVAEPGFLQTGTKSLIKNYYGDSHYAIQNYNIQTLMHKPDYTATEFDISHEKIIELNTVVRPCLNQIQYDETYKYLNCIESWVRALGNEELRDPITLMQ